MAESAQAAVAGLVLAAGEGRRYGRPKALVEFDGERLVDRAVRLAHDGGCSPVVVVAGAAPLAVDGARVVDNADWRSGMGSSLRAGLAALPATASAVVVLLVDTPWLGPEAVRRLIAAHQTGAELASATYDGERGHPVLLGRGHWAGVAASAAGDAGARAYLARQPALVIEVDCTETGNPTDVDFADFRCEC
ncbi:MAG: nucleotidyltransferase family protein [Jiangellaceae bacterium]